MHLQSERLTLFRRVALYVDLTLFLGLFSMMALKLFGQWARQNPYLIFLACVFLASFVPALVAGGAARLSVTAARLRLGAFALIVTAALLFVTLVPLPITSVMIAVRQVPQSMEFFLMHHVDDNRDKWRSVYKIRGDVQITVSFILPQPIRGRDTNLRVYLGCNPHRVYFGRSSPAVDIYRVSYGTDFFRLPLPLAIYEGEDLLKEAGVIAMPGRSLLVNHAIRATKMEIMWDEDRVRRDSGLVPMMLIKLLWVVFYSGISALVLWSFWRTPKVRPVWEAIEGYLTHRLIK